MRFSSRSAEIAKSAAIGATEMQMKQMLCRTPLDVFNLHGRIASAPPAWEQIAMERQAGFVVS